MDEIQQELKNNIDMVRRRASKTMNPALEIEVSKCEILLGINATLKQIRNNMGR